MKYLCLVYGQQKALDALSASDMNVLIKESLDYDEVLRTSGHFMVAQALEPVQAANTLSPMARFGSIEVRPIKDLARITAP